MKLRRVKWVKGVDTIAEEGWLHQFIAVVDGDQYLVPSAIVEQDDGEVKVLIGIDDWYKLWFVEPYRGPWDKAADG